MKHILFLLILLAFSCSDRSDDVIADECTEPIGCTFELRTISITIKNQAGDPYKLDEYYIVKLATGKEIDTKYSADIALQQKFGSYPLLGDSHMKDTNKAGQEFIFTGKKKGKVVIRKSYLIGHNCCHIELKKGDTELVIAE